MLPPELRNIIFKLVYTAETDDDGTIGLSSTNPPTKHLALACRRLHMESYALFKAAFRAYWRHEFSLVIRALPTLHTISPHECNASEVNLARITRIQLICRPNTVPKAEWIVHLKKSSSSVWVARLAPQDFKKSFGAHSWDLLDFYKHRCNRWLAYLGEARETGLTPSLLPTILWTASRPLLFF